MIRTTTDFFQDIRSDLADRGDVDDEDQVRDTLWSDDDLLRYLNSAAARLASDTLALRKRFQITAAAGTPTYRFPYYQVLDIITAGFSSPQLGGGERELRPFDIDEGMYRDDYGVQIFVRPNFEATGQPSHFTRDWDNDFMRLYPIPAVAGVLSVSAIVLPDQIMMGMPIPFQAQQDWDLLLMWAKSLAYAKQDADVLDLRRAKSFENDYKLAVLDRKSEIDRIRRNNAILRPR